MQMLFEVTLFTAAIWLSVLWVKQSSGQSDALILASSTFMVAMGLSVTAMIRVSHTKGINDYKKLIVVARSIFCWLLETFSLLCLLFYITSYPIYS
jgi:MATE family multidrug resistance protein